jgi:hypothetical protein
MTRSVDDVTESVKVMSLVRPFGMESSFNLGPSSLGGRKTYNGRADASQFGLPHTGGIISLLYDVFFTMYVDGGDVSSCVRLAYADATWLLDAIYKPSMRSDPSASGVIHRISVARKANLFSALRRLLSEVDGCATPDPSIAEYVLALSAVRLVIERVRRDALLRFIILRLGPAMDDKLLDGWQSSSQGVINEISLCPARDIDRVVEAMVRSVTLPDAATSNVTALKFALHSRDSVVYNFLRGEPWFSGNMTGREDMPIFDLISLSYDTEYAA